MRLRQLVLLICALWTAAVGAEAPAGMTTRQYDALFASVNNAGRWGAGDARGTLNHITEETRVAAAREVRAGRTVSLVRQLEAGEIPGAIEPMAVTPFALDEGGIHWQAERIGLVFHGYAFSHVDALSHAAFRGRSYNGLATPGADRGRMGTETMKDGLVARGVLVDLPALRGVEYLEPGATFTPADIEAWEKRTGVSVGAGDVLLVRTGRWARQRVHGPVDPTKTQAGPHPTMAEWLHRRCVALVGDDGANDRAPSVVPGVSHPFHMLALVAMGMPLLDNMDLDQLTAECAAAKRWTFLFVATPLRIKDATGSPLGAVAVF
jgi:kynurenine formamidase